MQMALTALLLAAVLHSVGHIFLHLADNPSGKPDASATAQLAPLQRDEPANQIASNGSHSCAGCESLQKFRDVLPVCLAWATAHHSPVNEWQRVNHVTAPALALHASRAPPAI